VRPAFCIRKKKISFKLSNEGLLEIKMLVIMKNNSKRKNTKDGSIFSVLDIFFRRSHPFTLAQDSQCRNLRDQCHAVPTYGGYRRYCQPAFCNPPMPPPSQ
jgi:hypothetical protein